MSAPIHASVPPGSENRVRLDTVRLISGWLQDNGYALSSQTLLDEAGMHHKERHQQRKLLRQLSTHALEGNWDQLLSSLQKNAALAKDTGIMFATYRQQFLEQVDSGEHAKALGFFMKRIKPLEQQVSHEQFQALSYCLTCKSVSECPAFSSWTPSVGRAELRGLLDATHAGLAGDSLGAPYIHTHSLTPVSGDLSALLLDGIKYRRLLASQTAAAAASEAGNPNISTPVRPPNAITVHALINDVTGSVEALAPPTTEVKRVVLSGAHGTVPAAVAEKSPMRSPLSLPASPAGVAPALHRRQRCPKSLCVLPRDGIVIAGCDDGTICAVPMPTRGRTSSLGANSSAGRTPPLRPQTSGSIQDCAWLPMQHASRVWALSAARSASRFVSAGGRTLLVWVMTSPNSFTSVAELEHMDEVLACAISRDGSYALSGTMAGDLVLWDAGAAAAASIGSRQTPGIISPSVGQLGRATDDGNRRLPNRSPYHLKTLSFSSSPIVDIRVTNVGSAAFVAYREGTVRMVDLAVGVAVREFTPSIPSELTAIDLSAGGTRLLVSYRNNTIRFFDILSGSLLPVKLTGHFSSAQSFVRAAFTTRDAFVCAASESGDVPVWDVADAINGYAVAEAVPGEDGLGSFASQPGQGLAPIADSEEGTPHQGVRSTSTTPTQAPPTMAVLPSAPSVAALHPCTRLRAHTSMVGDVKYVEGDAASSLLLTCGDDGSVVMSCVADGIVGVTVGTGSFREAP